MQNQTDTHQDNGSRSGFKSFAFKRFVVAAILIVLVVWALSIGPGMMQKSENAAPHAVTMQEHSASETKKPAAPAPGHSHVTAQVADHPAGPAQAPSHAPVKPPASDPNEEVKALLQEQPAAKAIQDKGRHQPSSDHPTTKAGDTAVPHMAEDKTAKTPPEQDHSQTAQQAQPHGPAPEVVHADRPTGVAFVEAVIAPLDHELNEHFWGWRPNDIVNFTDNVNHFQIGVLEVTRRSVVLLSERISRTGTTDAFNPHLEYAMNWLMVKADRYWFPAPESKYKESIKELKIYRQGLMDGQASFYTRSDNIIPLLASYEDLLGSCDENLVKQKREDGSKVSYFQADDYFFYAKGVASAMATILEAIHHDFAPTLESRHGAELLHHAIESCRQAAALDPLLITDGDLDGIFANHRAHMAAPISHARFYIGQLIKTLST